jgi:hypothetical protein
MVVGSGEGGEKLKRKRKNFELDSSGGIGRGALAVYL